MNLTSSSLFLSDQLEYVVHLLLSLALSLLQVFLVFKVLEKVLNFLPCPGYTVVKAAFFAIVHPQGPSRQSFPLSRSRSASAIGGGLRFDTNIPEFIRVFIDRILVIIILSDYRFSCSSSGRLSSFS